MPIAWARVPAPAPIGVLTVGVSEVGVAEVNFPGVRQPVTWWEDPDRTAPVVAQLTEYLAGQRRTFDVPIDWSVTAAGAHRTVLQTLHGTVHYGQSSTYGELAVRSGARFGNDLPARAVGSIMGANRLPVIVPCHRVLAADGLGGFTGGLEIKRWLLELEGVLPPTLDFGGS